MIIIDTNVLSELMRPPRNQAVREWMRDQSMEERYTTSVTLAEISYGTERLPEGRRKTLLQTGAEAAFAAFQGQILPFDLAAAMHYASIAATRDAIGRPIGPFDAQIAAICRAHGAALATRTVKDFEGLGLELVDPWS